MLLCGSCGPGSADRSLTPPAPVRVAVSSETDRAALESRSATSTVAHLQELLYDPIRGLEIVRRHHHQVVISVAGAGLPPSEVAQRLGGPDILGARAEGDHVVIELSSVGAAERFDLGLVGLEGGTYQLGPVGLVLIPREGSDSAPLQLVPNPLERHWRLLNGDHVDVVPQLREAGAGRLASVASVVTVELPTTNLLALVVGANLSSAVGTRVVASLNLEAIAQAACGSECRAELPIPATGSAELPVDPDRPLELIYLDAAEAEALAARLISHQLGEAGIEVRLIPTDLGTFGRRTVASGEFDLALWPMPTDPERFRQRLKYSKISEDQLASSIIPLFELRFYAAYDTSICGVEPDSATSWDWLAGAYRCEDPSL